MRGFSSPVLLYNSRLLFSSISSLLIGSNQSSPAPSVLKEVAKHLLMNLWQMGEMNREWMAVMAHWGFYEKILAHVLNTSVFIPQSEIHHI